MSALPPGFDHFREVIGSQVEKMGAELVDLSLRRSRGRATLTVIADTAGGITLDDCARINRGLNVFLDEGGAADTGQDWLEDSYVLEVNSPGLDRPLKTRRDFLRARGEKLSVTYQQPDGKTTTVRGLLEEASDDSIQLEINSGRLQLPLAVLIRAVRDIKI